MPSVSSSQSQANAVFGAVTQTIIMDCSVAAVVGDLVRQDQTVDSRVEIATDNLKSYQVIGRISKKPTTTTCEVILRGVIDVTLMDRGRVYLSALGEFTITAPPLNYLQMLGYSFGNGKLHFEPNTISTFRS